MEDVVLHYQPGSAAGISSLLQRTEELVESFPCRTPPVFTPWFPAAADCHLPIRPAKPAPVITFSESRLHTRTAQPGPQKPETDGLLVERPLECLRTETTTSPHENPQEAKDNVPDNCLLSASWFNTAEREITRLSPDKHKGGSPVTDSLARRSWSVFTQRGVLLRSSPPLSKQFHHVVSVHRLHLRQRVKWVISQHNCGASRDIEQVSIHGPAPGAMLAALGSCT